MFLIMLENITNITAVSGSFFGYVRNFFFFFLIENLGLANYFEIGNNGNRSSFSFARSNLFESLVPHLFLVPTIDPERRGTIFLGSSKRPLHGRFFPSHFPVVDIFSTLHPLKISVPIQSKNH